MTLGLLILLAVVGVAQMAALAARRRLIRRRTEALEAAEAETWFTRLRAACPPPGGAMLPPFAGLPVYVAPRGTMPDDVAAYVLAGVTAGPIETKWQDGDALEDLLRAQRIMREYRFGMEIADRARPPFTAIITAL